MKVIAWNLAHQVKKRPIPDYLVEVIQDLEADTVLFNEYVDDPSRDSFKADLTSAGYAHQLVSFSPGNHNQVFAVSRQAFDLGDLQPPQASGSAVSNFLHIRFREYPVEMVGVRAPFYQKKKENRKIYWEELAEIMRSVRGRPILFAGDVNYNPFKEAKQSEAKTVPFHLCSEYDIPNPKGEWSYLSSKGNGSRIDHVLHTSHLNLTNVEYVDWIRGRFLAGEKIKKPISDHAVLRFDVS